MKSWLDLRSQPSNPATQQQSQLVALGTVSAFHPILGHGRYQLFIQLVKTLLKPKNSQQTPPGCFGLGVRNDIVLNSNTIPNVEKQNVAWPINHRITLAGPAGTRARFLSEGTEMTSIFHLPYLHTTIPPLRSPTLPTPSRRMPLAS